ncbi:MAG: type 1 glutamine amidotransferase [Pirellulales bacterium]|nr:type 1 glutamine amidotransferase [Pirellulales bacterium]
MRVLILQIRNPGDPMIEAEIGAFAQVLGKDREEITVSTLLVDPPRPQDLRPYDLLLIGGSGDYSVTHRDKPWLEPALESVRGAVETGKPLFASCFGFQAIAQALGGNVVHDKSRAELGTNPVQLTESGKADPVFGELSSPFLAQMGHEDCVETLPEGAVLLASTQRVRNQAYRLRDKPVYATQFHPELDRNAFLDRLQAYPKYVEQIAGVPFEQFTKSCQETPESNSLLRRFVTEYSG